MTLTHTQNKAKPGMTLLELTVVILVLLSLISILFVGARAWKKGSDRAANIMNLRNVQQAVRSEQNLKDMTEGETLLSSVIIAPGSYIETAPVPPAPLGSGGVVPPYTYSDDIPTVGSLFVTGPTGVLPGETYGHNDASDVSDW